MMNKIKVVFAGLTAVVLIGAAVAIAVSPSTATSSPELTDVAPVSASGEPATDVELLEDWEFTARSREDRCRIGSPDTGN
ncbi:hypothetical protein Mal15_51380 [Stieleria maiorica]|uniref:Secreted protein n=1 Tax=Stieleria maiorica TaxID=2795974 RepID=A0A5B9MIJ5_9BACT|nr:hypothetical protein [Stieleria maiorica]QEG01062.1 hypothetical protein Mal15_51380 [Stieleria maiorica]